MTRADRALVAPLALFMIGHGLLETARDALFLSRIPAARLPWAYLAIAVLALPLARLVRRASRRHPGCAMLPAGLVLAAAVTAAIWLASARAPGFGVYGLYVWTGVVATVVVISYWSWLAERVSAQRTAPTYARANAGAIAGVAAGSALAAGLIEWLEARHLLLGAALVFAVAAAAAARTPVSAQAGEADDVRLRSLPRRRGVRALGLIILAGAVTLTAADLLFKLVVADQVPRAELGRFFARFYGVVNVLALILQLVVVPRLVRRAAASTLPLPLVVATGALGFAAVPVLGLLMLLKLGEASLRHSLHRTGVEVLFLSLPAAVRRPARRLIESAAQRGGQALGALLVLAALSLGVGRVEIALLIATAAAVWTVAVVAVLRSGSTAPDAAGALFP
jgi:ATP:ADP antiporter, AAA family